MLTELYIEALLIDEDLADQVWELWNARVITDGLAVWANSTGPKGGLKARLRRPRTLTTAASGCC